MSIIDELITNRTSGTYYNATDINRVSQAIEYVAGILYDAGYYVLAELKTDWTIEDIFYSDDAEYVIYLLDELKNSFASLQPSEYPNTLDGLTYVGANQIEKFLQDVDLLIQEIKAAYIECGTVECGEV